MQPVFERSCAILSSQYAGTAPREGLPIGAIRRNPPNEGCFDYIQLEYYELLNYHSESVNPVY